MTFKEIWKYMQDTEGWQKHPFNLISDDVLHKEAGIRFYTNCNGITFYSAAGGDVVYRSGVWVWLLMHWPAYKIRKQLRIKK